MNHNRPFTVGSRRLARWRSKAMRRNTNKQDGEGILGMAWCFTR